MLSIIMGVLKSQKAPSAKRCIKTLRNAFTHLPLPSQKALSAKRCIKTKNLCNIHAVVFFLSESTERHKVH